MMPPQWFKDYFYFEKRELIILISVIVFITALLIYTSSLPTRQEREKARLQKEMEMFKKTVH